MELCTAHKIADDPAERAWDMPHHRLGHIGPDEFFKSKKIVSGRNLPIRCTYFDQPARKVPRIERAGLDRQQNRPNALKAIAFPLKQLVIPPRITRLVTTNVNDMPPPYHSNADLAS